MYDVASDGIHYHSLVDGQILVDGLFQITLVTFEDDAFDMCANDHTSVIFAYSGVWLLSMDLISADLSGEAISRISVPKIICIPGHCLHPKHTWINFGFDEAQHCGFAINEEVALGDNRAFDIPILSQFFLVRGKENIRIIAVYTSIQYVAICKLSRLFCNDGHQGVVCTFANGVDGTRVTCDRDIS
jgi:hypothetical protein